MTRSGWSCVFSGTFSVRTSPPADWDSARSAAFEAIEPLADALRDTLPLLSLEGKRAGASADGERGNDSDGDGERVGVVTAAERVGETSAAAAQSPVAISWLPMSSVTLLLELGSSLSSGPAVAGGEGSIFSAVDGDKQSTECEGKLPTRGEIKSSVDEIVTLS